MTITKIKTTSEMKTTSTMKTISNMKTTSKIKTVIAGMHTMLDIFFYCRFSEFESHPDNPISFEPYGTFYGCPTKYDPHGFCLIPLATNMLESWHIILWKGGIHSFVWSPKTFLYNIREPKYQRIKMGYQISKCLNIGQFQCLEIWYCCDLCIFYFKDDFLIKHAESSNPFLWNLREPK